MGSPEIADTEEARKKAFGGVMQTFDNTRPQVAAMAPVALSEDEGTIEDVLEPYLIANGYIERTARGRIATQKSYEHFKLSGPGSELLDD